MKALHHQLDPNRPKEEDAMQGARLSHRLTQVSESDSSSSLASPSLSPSSSSSSSSPSPPPVSPRITFSQDSFASTSSTCSTSSSLSAEPVYQPFTARYEPHSLPLPQPKQPTAIKHKIIHNQQSTDTDSIASVCVDRSLDTATKQLRWQRGAALFDAAIFSLTTTSESHDDVTNDSSTSPPSSPVPEWHNLSRDARNDRRREWRQEQKSAKESTPRAVDHNDSLQDEVIDRNLQCARINADKLSATSE